MRSEEAAAGAGEYVPLGDGGVGGGGGDGGLEMEEFSPGHRPGSGGDSPSLVELLRGESTPWRVPADLDRFLERVYRYYCDKGFWCILTMGILELLTLGFTIAFSALLLLVIDWHGLLNARCGVAAAEQGYPPCNLALEAVHAHPLSPFTFAKAVVLVYLLVFSVYWAFCFARFFAQLRDVLEIRDFCQHSLGISERELQTMAWPVVLDHLTAFQNRRPLCMAKDLTPHDMVLRIMRKENYLVGMLNKDVLAFPCPSWLPGVERRAGRGVMLTKTMEWSLNWCLLQHMFDRNFLIKKDFVAEPEVLRKRLMAVGCTMLLLSPFLTIFMLIYFFLRNAEQFYHQPSTAGSRRWSNLAQWRIREFNEVEHLFNQRLDTSYKYAVDYTKQFPSHILSMVAKFVSFITGAFAAVLLGIALVDESLLEAQVFGRNLFWFAAILGTILAVSRSLIMEECTVYNPELAMGNVVQHTHYLPKHWRGLAGADSVRAEFESMFQFKALLFFEEMLSIFTTPFILWFFLPECVDRVLQFVQDFTVYVDGVGHVCSLSAYDFASHGNANYGSPLHTGRHQRSSQGKMEKSFLSFKSHYPTWEPDEHGQHFLSTITGFRILQEESQNMQSKHSLQQATLLPALLSGATAASVRLDNPGNQRSGHVIPGSHGRSFFPEQSHGPGSAAESHQVGSMSLTNLEQVQQLHWLNKYYLARSAMQASALQPQGPGSALGHVDELPHVEATSEWRRLPVVGLAAEGMRFQEPPSFGGASSSDGRSCSRGESEVAVQAGENEWAHMTSGGSADDFALSADFALGESGQESRRTLSAELEEQERHLSSPPPPEGLR
eukprot:SM000082S22895  [mRNA]  locus=s82:523573:527908:- [translate_table: standard]